MTTACRLPVWIPLFAALCTSLSPGCATAPQRGGPPAEGGMRPLSVPVTLVAGEGDARPSAGRPFTQLAKDAPSGDVDEIRAASGAVLTLGSPDAPRAKLWLSGGTSVRLGEDDGGGVIVAVTRGAARARSFEEPGKLSVMTPRGTSRAARAD